MSPDLASFRALPDHLQFLVAFKALLGPYEARAQLRLLPVMLNAVESRLPREGKWHQGAIRTALNSLKNLHFLDKQGKLLHEHELACEAVNLIGGERLGVAFQQALPLPDAAAPRFPRASTGEIVALFFIHFRLAVYCNDAEGFRHIEYLLEQYRKKVPTEAFLVGDPFEHQFCEVPYTLEWFLSRAMPLRGRLYLNALSSLNFSLHSPHLTPLLAYVRQHPECTGDLDPTHTALILYRLFCGDFQTARAGLAVWRKDKDEIFGPLLGGMLDFFAGGNDAAIGQLRDALKRLRRLSGDRREFLRHPGGLCLLLALLRADDISLHSEVENLLDTVLPQHGPYQPGYAAVRSLLLLAQGKSRDAVHALETAFAGQPETHVSVLSDILPLAARFLLRGEAPHLWGTAEFREAERLFALYADSIPLQARLLGDLLEQSAPDPRPYAAFRRAFPVPVINFSELIRPHAAWEHDLERLRRVLIPTRKSPARRRRLVWLLDSETCDIHPVQQNMNAKGVWTAGREVSLKRLALEGVNLPWLTDRDRRVLAALRPHSDWYTTTYAFDLVPALRALAGHPLIFLRADRHPVSLETRPLEIVVQEGPAGYAIRLSGPDGQTLPEFRDCYLCRESEDRCVAWVLIPELEPAAEILGTAGFALPKESAEQVMALIREHDPSLPLRTEIAGTETATASVLPVFQLRPLESGLHVVLGVRPFGPEDGQSPFFPPGKGNPAPLRLRNGVPVQLRRDFQEERERATRVVRNCPLLRTLSGLSDRPGADATAGLPETEWRLDTPQEALQCLLELQSCPEHPALEWPEGGRMRVVVPVPGARMQVEVHREGDWFGLEGRFSPDGKRVLEMSRILDVLDQARGSFVPLGDGDFLALTRRFHRQLERLAMLSEPAEKHGGDRRIHPLAAPAVEEMLESAADGTADEPAIHIAATDPAWKDLLRRIREARELSPAVPTTLRAELRDYQREGFVWLARLAHWGAGACLADDMGLGKTLQTIAVMLRLAPEGPCLVVAPTSVCHNWEQELARFAPTLRTYRLGTGDREGLVASLEPGDVLIASYGLLGRARNALAARRWRMAVFDEAQALKNAATQRAKAARALTADFRVALTGTPIENYLEDLWSLFNILNPGLLGSLRAFQRRFGGRRAAEGALTDRQALKALIRPFLLRRTKSAVLEELPPRTEQTILVQAGRDEHALYEALRRNALDTLAARKEEDGAARRLHILAELTRLRRACCHPALIHPETDIESSKLAVFMDIIEELRRGGHKALVFSQFVGCLALVRKALDAAGVSYQYLDGGTPEARRREGVAAFQRGEGDLFLISLKAGGQGLNLTAADYVIHLDPWWNPAVEDQATDRAHRIGQQRPVTIYRLVVEGTVEEKILRLHAAKRALAADFLEGADTPSAPTEEELLELLR